MVKREIVIVVLIIILGIAILFIVNYLPNYHPPQENSSDKKFCTAASRENDICTLEYAPVCGWFNSSIKCIKYPCAGTYGNGCQACSDDKVEYYTYGECPK